MTTKPPTKNGASVAGSTPERISGDSWVVVFDYREDNGPTHVGPFNTKGGAEHWLSMQREYEACVVPLTWHDQWLPTQPTDDAPGGTLVTAPNLAVVRGRQVVTGERSGDGDRRQRSQQVLVRLTPIEHADATALAARHGLSLPALLRAGLTYLAATETPHA